MPALGLDYGTIKDRAFQEGSEGSSAAGPGGRIRAFQVPETVSVMINRDKHRL
jgi:hypothetical protein